MERFAFTEAGCVVEPCTAPGGADLSCCKCKQPVRVDASDATRVVFVHKGRACAGKASAQPANDVARMEKSNMTPCTANSDWERAWDGLAKTTMEKSGVGIRRDDKSLKHVLNDGCSSETPATQTVLFKGVFCEFTMVSVQSVCICDATSAWIGKYSFSHDAVWFCRTSSFLRLLGPSGEKHPPLFHCADGALYQSKCNEALHLELNGVEVYAWMLVPLHDATRSALDEAFGMNWPPQQWKGAPLFCPAASIDLPVRVLGEAGRLEVDACHRAHMWRFPTVARTVVSAPPGAGKTTAIVEMMRRWKKRALVITFNKATQETMQQRIREAGLMGCHARTIDSLCHEACSNPDLMKWSDWELCHMFWPKSAHTKFGRNGGGRRAADIIDFRFRHPRARVSICKQHRRLAVKGREWDADVSSYPMWRIAQGCMTHAAARYDCDQRRSLGKRLDVYDIVLVDEMQDLVSAQEQRLLFQTTKPVVLVGDPMQAINGFRDDPPCMECHLEQEVPPALPPSLEWYGTWRLDAFTTRFVEARFGRRMHSYRNVDERSEVFWKDDLVFANTLVLCRYNQSVVETAIRFPELHVVGGDTLAQRLAAAAKDDTMVSPMAGYAQKLAKAGRLDAILALLRTRAVRLSNVKDIAAVSTVHQTKGFEYDHCAVHADLLAPENSEEQNISFVAFTRHRRSLVVMTRDGAPPPPSSPTNTKTTSGQWVFRRL